MEEKNLDDLVTQLERICAPLVYVSETDAPITVFVAGEPVDLNADAMRAATSVSTDARVEEIDFQKFFARMTKTEEWHGDVEKAQTKKFLELQKLLEEHLRNLKVFKIGTVRLKIYAVGLDRNNNVIGITTEAVET